MNIILGKKPTKNEGTKSCLIFFNRIIFCVQVIAKECNGNVMEDSQQTNENHITEQNEADIVVNENSYM